LTDRILGMTAASARLGIHYCTLRNWTDEGKIPYVRDSAGRRLFDEAVIVKMAKDRQESKAEVMV